MYDVAALGELLIDFAPQSVSPEGYPTLAAQPGGAPGNFLAALSKYGCRTVMIGKVGDDAFGRLLVKTLKDAGIGTGGVLTDPDVFTTMAFVSLDEHGNRDFSFARKPGADTCLKPEEVDGDLIAEAKVFHFGTLSLREEDAKAAIEWSLRQADIVKISDEEIEWLWGLSPEQGAEKLLNEYGVSLVYATLGPKGCHAATRSVHTTVGSPSGIQVVDTTGAGDIFGGSAMSRFLRTGKAPGNLTEAELREIVRFACTAASLSTRKHGGITSVPDEEEVLACM